MKSGRLTAILSTGLLVGTLDAIAAIVNYCIPTIRNPIRIFQYIASGVVGPEAAFEGGWMTAAMGVLFHYLIATTWTALFYVAYPTIHRMVPHKIVVGIAYGVVIWLIMNLLVLPMSRVPHGPLHVSGSFIGAGILIVAVGLPVSIRASKFYASK